MMTTGIEVIEFYEQVVYLNCNMKYHYEDLFEENITA